MADEAGSFPPRTDQGLVNALRIAMKFQLEVDPLHLMAAAGMRAGWIIVVDMR